jgi:hypothetical protein
MDESTDAGDTVSTPTPILVVRPIVVSVPGRAVDFQVRVSAPMTGSELPIIILSQDHDPSNHLSSLNVYVSDGRSREHFLVNSTERPAEVRPCRGQEPTFLRTVRLFRSRNCGTMGTGGPPTPCRREDETTQETNDNVQLQRIDCGAWARRDG